MSCVKSIHGIKCKSYVMGDGGQKRKFWMTHIPVHPQEIRGEGSFNMHGHIHHHKEDFMNKDSETYNPRYINVNLDALWERKGIIMLSHLEISDYINGEYYAH